MSSRIKKDVIFLTKGDSLWLQVEIYDKDGTVYVPSADDHIRFALNKTLNTDDPLLVKDISNDTLELIIEDFESEPLEVGTFWYDVEIVHSNGFRDTFIGPNKFIVTDEVF